MSYESANASEYDGSVNRFSPEGRLFQIEYACQAVNIGSIAIGIKTDEGIVFAAEKRLPNKLIVPSSVKKVISLDDHLLFASSGLSPDAQKLYELVFAHCMQHSRVFAEPISVHAAAKQLSREFGRFADFDDDERLGRVYGCAVLVGGYDRESQSFALYHLNPSASIVGYKAKAIGSGALTVENELKRTFAETPSLSLEAAQKSAVESLKMVMEDKMSAENFDFAVLTRDGVRNFTMRQKQELIDMYTAPNA